MLMTKTSTQPVHSLIKEVVTLTESSDDLGDDEQKFYNSIKKDLKKIERKPGNSLIENILHYSRLLKI